MPFKVGSNRPANSAAQDLAALTVTVNAVALGNVDTQMINNDGSSNQC
jgi:hypothetical protein